MKITINGFRFICDPLGGLYIKFRTFTSEDQIAFAKLSGDYNPLHIDAVAARRLLYGSQVVHGIHALLWSLDCYFEDRAEEIELRSIKVFFTKPIKVGEEIRLSLRHDNEGHLRIKILSGNSTLTKIDVELHQLVKQKCGYLKNSYPNKLPPRDLSYEEIEADSGDLELCLKFEAATKMFPHLIRYISPLQIATLLSMTRLVGAICPGLHSLFSELDLTTTLPNKNSTMKYEVTKLDKRFDLIHLKVTAPEMTGTIKAFRRPAPQEQASYLTLKNQVDSNEFADQRALVIGGSRGLGEVATKLLSAGGADVKITYYQGMEDTRRIVDDIVSNGGIADSFHFDVLNPKIDPLNISINDWVPTHLYYFATPFIFSGVKGIFSPHLFNKFCDYYVVGLINTVNQVSNLGIRHIFYPSSIAIEELPTNMGEYAAAKIASEQLCTFLEKTDLKIKIYKPRLPRVATDQTVSIMPVTIQDPAPIMLKELRTFRDLPIKN